jgi:hypothetical protein
MAKCLIVTLLSYLLSSGTVLASKYAGEFLTLGMGARAAGLGGAYSSIANDAAAPYWNPAGVPLVKRKEIMGMHSEIFGGAVRYDCIGIVFPADNSAFGANLFLLSIRNIKFTAGLEHEDFGLDGIDGTGDEGEHDGELDPGELIIYDEKRIQSVTDNDLTLFLSYGWALSERLSFGAGLKMIRREIGDYSAYGSGADLGIIYRPVKTVSLGLNLQDATTTFISWSTGTWERILPTLKLGISTNHWVENLRGTLLFSIDQDIRFEGRRRTSQFSIGSVSDDFRLGVEYLYSEVVGIRAGLEYGELTAGMGIRYRNYVIDYAFLSHPDLHGSYRLSLSAFF